MNVHEGSRTGGIQHCGCDWDPGYHRDLNIRRGKADSGARCTNSVDEGAFGASSGICTACLFGCAA